MSFTGKPNKFEPVCYRHGRTMSITTAASRLYGVKGSGNEDDYLNCDLYSCPVANCNNQVMMGFAAAWDTSGNYEDNKLRPHTIQATALKEE